MNGATQRAPQTSVSMSHKNLKWCEYCQMNVLPKITPSGFKCRECGHELTESVYEGEW